MTTFPPVSLPGDELNHKNDTEPEWWYFHGHLFDEASNGLAAFEFTVIDIDGVYYAYAGLADFSGSTPVYTGDDRFGGVYSENRSDSTFDIAMNFTGSEPSNRWKIVSSRPREDEVSYQLLVNAGDNNRKHWNLALTATARKDPLLVGDNGVILDNGKPSWLYSRTRLDLDHHSYLSIEGGGYRRVTGTAWMDHQWGTPRPFDRQWRWIGVQDDKLNEEYLFMVVIDARPPHEVKLHLGYWIDRTGKGHPLDFEMTVVREWQGWPIDHDVTFEHPGTGDATTLAVRADVDDQRRVPKPRMPPAVETALEDVGALHHLVLWEGSCTVSRNGAAFARAFTELGGYG